MCRRRSRTGINCNDQIGRVTAVGSLVISRPQFGDRRLAVLLAEDKIFSLRSAMNFVQAVRLVFHQFRRELFRKKYLPGMRGMSFDISLLPLRATFTLDDFSAFAHFEMNVICPAHIKPGKNGFKGRDPVAVRKLNPPQKSHLIRRLHGRRKAHAFWWTFRPSLALRIKVASRRPRWRTILTVLPWHS